MQISEGLRTRISTRAFLTDPLAEDVVHQILDTARWSPSGGNLQPWKVIAVTGAAKQDPADLWEPYRTRRYQVGKDMYETLGIPRDDRAARLARMARTCSSLVPLWDCSSSSIGAWEMGSGPIWGCS